MIRNSIVNTIKASAKVTVTITERNTVMQNALNCQITSTNKMNVKIRKTFPTFLKVF